VNRVRFAGRYRGVALPPGTYTLTATAHRRGRTVALGRTTVVIVPPGAEPADAKPQRTTCRSARDGNDSVAAAALLGNGDGGGRAFPTKGTGVAGTSADAANGANGANGGESEAIGASGDSARGGRLLGVVPTPFEGAPAWLQTLLLLGLGAAIILLLLAALPASRVRPAGASTLVLHRRTELAVGGATMLAGAAILALVL
jgi:hypothetical protein